MAQAKTLSTRPVGKGQEAEFLNRELVPVVRQLIGGAVIEGSRAGGAALENLLAALVSIGVIRDETTP